MKLYVQCERKRRVSSTHNMAFFSLDARLGADGTVAGVLMLTFRRAASDQSHPTTSTEQVDIKSE
jgi:hypothetical protein